MRTHSSLVLRSGVLALAGVLVVPLAARAQSGDTSSSTPVAVGGYTVEGSLSAGYRVTDVSGYEDKYRELYNLRDGLRLTDFNLFGRAQKGQDLFADTFSMSASGLGGDPFEAVQFMAQKHDAYDLRVNFRRSNFFWDQNDGIVENRQSAVTNSQSWNTERNLGSMSLLLHLSSHLRLGFDVYHSGRTGSNLTTRTVDFFGSPSVWGNFARANAFTMLAPVNETANRYTGGFDYTWQNWNLHYRAGYQIFDDAVNANAATAPELSIDVTDPVSATEPLQNGSYQDFRRLTTPISEFSFNGKVAPKVTWRGGYMFYRYSGPAGLEASYQGNARSIGAYDVSLDTRATVREPTHVLDQGVTWQATDWMNVLADYRYQWIGIDSAGEFVSVFNGTTNTGSADNQWREHKNQLDVDLEFMPRTNLLLRGGVRYLRNDVRVIEDGVLDTTYETKLINTVWPTFSLWWKPGAMVDVHADVDSISNDVSYTRLTPQTNVGSRIMVNVHPTDAWSIVDALNVRHETLDAADYTANIRSNALTANYQVNDNVALFGGYTYDGLHATASATFIRGTPPLNVTLLDNTVNHVWQAGASLKPIPRLGVDASINYVRTTGEGTITGETPLYGPIKYPYGTASVYYEFPTIGRLSVDYTRVDYTEALTTLDNFGARIVMVRWTHGF